MDAADNLVFVDLETTGGNPAYHRITEVGIVRVQNGKCVEEWSSLVNPECAIAPYVQAFNGISSEMVADAPRFADIAAAVFEKLRGAVFIAHNARFDYAFLRGEFRKAGMEYSAQALCTVKLSRRLFPCQPRHNLDAVMQRHGLTCGTPGIARWAMRGCCATCGKNSQRRIPAGRLGCGGRAVAAFGAEAAGASAGGVGR